jgi:uncharacterized protein (DUF2342 family)
MEESTDSESVGSIEEPLSIEDMDSEDVMDVVRVMEEEMRGLQGFLAKTLSSSNTQPGKITHSQLTWIRTRLEVIRSLIRTILVLVTSLGALINGPPRS